MTCATATRCALHVEGVDVVLHNVAQVPLAKDRELFDAVNVVGTANVLVAARDAGVAKVVHTSSSAVFGIPEHNPVTERTPCRPLEAYGRAKLRAEVLCHEAVAAGPRRHDHPAPHDPRSRPARDHGDPVRVRR